VAAHHVGRTAQSRRFSVSPKPPAPAQTSRRIPPPTRCARRISASGNCSLGVSHPTAPAPGVVADFGEYEAAVVMEAEHASAAYAAKPPNGRPSTASATMARRFCFHHHRQPAESPAEIQSSAPTPRILKSSSPPPANGRADRTHAADLGNRRGPPQRYAGRAR